MTARTVRLRAVPAPGLTGLLVLPPAALLVALPTGPSPTAGAGPLRAV